MSIFRAMGDALDHWRDQFGTQYGEFEFEIDREPSDFRSPNEDKYTKKTRSFSSMQEFSFSEFLLENWPSHLDGAGSTGEIDPPLDFPPFPERSPEFTCTNQHHNHSVPKQHELDILLGKLNRNFGKHHSGSAAGPLAFYRPFHFEQHWGMFFLVDRLADLAKLRAQNIKDNQQYGHYFADDGIIENMVFWKTFYHEVYHHKIEMFATKLEFALREKVYCKYFHKFYCRTKGLDYCLEEAFANVYGALKCAELMKEQIPKAITIQVLREHFLIRAPNGYKLAYSILELSQQKIKLLEQEFLEILSSYAFDEIQEEHRCGRRSDPIHPELYGLFTYSLHPKINTDNKVTFLIPS